ncbi:MAG: Chorismate mutase type II [Candidatus Argoarchaeum ethanivorans]|uniref:Chorismate mutase type II n=1 Tax=Candidatus Argoarchaeum ethanivorans TaxID=2608793 RepID=A0A811T4S5_9EURY|nr:MAG: Chorismate mutase type II [Candidatus Argoarchaeum ethanivorans]CAD6491001.1 MAG: Chorismate mutase type II [Candidatus Argoarchaeum ethanivorans]CAD6492194.1 MAG: Chorismate mutase type II [Candidatus Argoarchaeum ethanivorans]
MTLQHARDEISKLDWDIISLIAKRTKLAEAVLREKRIEDMQINDELQSKIVLNRATENATELGLDVGEIKKIFEILIRINIEKQKELMGGGNLP